MWDLNGTAATLHLDPLVGSLQLDRPDAGLAIETAIIDGSRTQQVPMARLWKIALPCGVERPTVLDSWIRGNDLITTYGPTATHPSRTQVYWRILSTTGAIGLELMVSVQTDALDDDPTTGIISEFSETVVHTGEVWWQPEAPEARPAAPIVLDATGTQPVSHRPGACLIRMAGFMTYVEVVHPRDFGLVQLVGQGGLLQLKTRLFETHLEKGVIRRGRVRCWFLPTADDLSAAARLCREFADSEPPLTT